MKFTHYRRAPALLAAPLAAQDKPLNTPPEWALPPPKWQGPHRLEGAGREPEDGAEMLAEELAKKQAEADDAHEHWKVEDGVLVYSGKGKMSLCTGKDYGNFELYCDWKSRRTATAAFISAERRKQIWDPFNGPNKKRRGEGFRKFVEQQKELAASTYWPTT